MVAISTRLSLLVLGCALLNGCLAAPVEEARDLTNAERFARGLPPKRPQFIRRGALLTNELLYFLRL
jgi:hypothetical protein